MCLLLNDETQILPSPIRPSSPPHLQKPKHPKAKCTFAYEAQNDDELSLELGDIITITKQEDEGWWDGELNGWAVVANRVLGPGPPPGQAG